MGRTSRTSNRTRPPAHRPTTPISPPQYLVGLVTPTTALTHHTTRSTIRSCILRCQSTSPTKPSVTVAYGCITERQARVLSARLGIKDPGWSMTRLTAMVQPSPLPSPATRTKRHYHEAQMLAESLATTRPLIYPPHYQELLEYLGRVRSIGNG